MAFQRCSRTDALSRSAGLSLAACALFIVGGFRPACGQETKRSEASKSSGSATEIARGKYIVEGVAACGDCHTPRLANGELDGSRWLAGAPVPYLSARPQPDWPIVAPRLADLPPGTDAQMIKLLTTGIWVNGKPLRSPMPHFRMTRADADAVLAYLKSVAGSRRANQ